MKKLLALILAAVMLMSLAACRKKKTEPTEPPTTVPVTTEAPTLPPTLPPTESPTEPPTEATEAPTEPPTEPAVEETEPPREEKRPEDDYTLPEGFERVDEIVYAVRIVNIRSGPAVSSDYVGTLYRGETLQRIGKNDDINWSAVIYKDELCYIASGYLTTNGDAHTGNYTSIPYESAAGGTMTTTRLVNFRKGPASYTTMLGQIPGNVSLKRLAVASNGWVKVDYNGTVGYVAAGYLKLD